MEEGKKDGAIQALSAPLLKSRELLVDSQA